MQVYLANVKKFRKKISTSDPNSNDVRALAWICLSMERVYGLKPGIGYRWVDYPD